MAQLSIQCSRCITGCNDAEWHWLKTGPELCDLSGLRIDLISRLLSLSRLYSGILHSRSHSQSHSRSLSHTRSTPFFPLRLELVVAKVLRQQSGPSQLLTSRVSPDFFQPHASTSQGLRRLGGGRGLMGLGMLKNKRDAIKQGAWVLLG